MMTPFPVGKIHLVGAGPGDPELITVKGKRFEGRRFQPPAVIIIGEVVNLGRKLHLRGETNMCFQ